MYIASIKFDFAYPAQQQQFQSCQVTLASDIHGRAAMSQPSCYNAVLSKVYGVELAVEVVVLCLGFAKIYKKLLMQVANGGMYLVSVGFFF